MRAGRDLTALEELRTQRAAMSSTGPVLSTQTYREHRTVPNGSVEIAWIVGDDQASVVGPRRHAVVDPWRATAALVLVVLGVGWNFGVVAGSALMVRSVAPALRP